MYILLDNLTVNQHGCWILIRNIHVILLILDATLKFNQSSYSVNEGNGMVSVVLVLSNASLSDVVIQIDSIDDSAAGEL